MKGRRVSARKYDYEHVDLRRASGKPTGDPEEDYADAFAMNLLMPEREVLRMHREGGTWIEMMVMFGVTQEVMVRRLRDLGLAA